MVMQGKGVKLTKAKVKKDAIDSWWARSWPAIVIGVDPGKRAGCAIVASHPGSISLVECCEVDTATRELETVIARAIDIANAAVLPLVLAVEDWGAGGNRGLAQWIGLGEQRGVWIRSFGIQCGDRKDGSRSGKKVVKVPQSSWRSRLCQKHGWYSKDGKFRKYDSEEWKQEAFETARVLFMESHVPPTENAAEAACIAYFAARADATGKALGKRYLKQCGLGLHELEGLINGKGVKS